MKRYVVAILVLGLGLSACAPLNTYYKPGVTLAALDRDRTRCRVKALRDVPRSTQVRRIPPEYIPPVRTCNAKGQCQTIRPGYFIPGELVTFDPGDGLRADVERQCMAARGYAPVSIPPCPDAVARATPAGVTKRLPKLGRTACVIRNSDGSFQIVNRG